MRTKWPFKPDVSGPLTHCAQECADYLAGLDASPGREPERTRLAAALGALLAAHSRHPGGTPGTELFDALLRAGDRAVEAGGRSELALAARLADTAVAVRRNSRGAWRLRALALDGLGRHQAAGEAVARYAELASDGSVGVRRLGELIDAKRAALVEAAARCAELPGDGPPEARAFAAAVAEEQHPEAVRAAFTAHLTARLAAAGAAGADVRRLAELYADFCRALDREPMPDPLLGGTEPLGVWDLRNRLAGRSVCVVTGRVPATALEGYDVVVRCGTFREGERADVHAVTAEGTACWDRPVTARLVFGDPAAQWRQAIRRAVPGAQQYLGDDSLRRPLQDPALLGEDDWDSVRTTSTFTVLRLLDFLDVTPCVDLFGFGLLRPEERDWVTARAKNSTETRTALR